MRDTDPVLSSNNSQDVWLPVVNARLGATYCPGGSPLQTPGTWGRRELEEQLNVCLQVADRTVLEELTRSAVSLHHVVQNRSPSTNDGRVVPG